MLNTAHSLIQTNWEVVIGFNKQKFSEISFIVMMEADIGKQQRTDQNGDENICNNVDGFQEVWI